MSITRKREPTIPAANDIQRKQSNIRDSSL
jgi:hypothetical protein